MGRVLAIDVGLKRCGLAWSDPLQLIAHNLEGCLRQELFCKVDRLVTQESISVIVLGLPKRLNNEPTHITEDVWQLARQIKQKYPTIQVFLLDERFTSKIATATLLQAGVSKKQRADKNKIDAISATILLQDFLEIWHRKGNTIIEVLLSD
ncbi:MAG: Holliday junction resolvase RuvX [Bacteroidia bacterium]|nr:Holliday junction resolvase RuvX [Bacteroidia bacterium]MDW8158294.1 Holliday junction resolvase RuvX [Bacteroidia bacterium]